ncbi:PREDICTED: ELKS/Rab6-interacting/CAST family member 1-like isoform X2 [Acropora digitifera]|uniref:ELKS/Rab6-interacting/CAST family member 1-like isoform X2 n=1 Tax=Acropora digitifera TaxID=70779 RepID=UPI000779F771|nr:PREDICTED: ELKS/Rab6-interacting/CAST family member 1-like isoform X2 [Acropora digitifera]
MENISENLEERAKMQSYRSVEQLEALSPSTASHTFKDHETLIQELKKENFDLKLRLYMEQKERERVTEDFKQKIVVLESDLTEALDELSDALEREKEYEASLESSQLREKALLNRQKRIEETCREQENEIQFLTLTKSKEKLSEKSAATCDAETMTDFPFYMERGVDVGDNGDRSAFADIDLKGDDSPRSMQTDTLVRQDGPRPEGPDLLNTNSGTLLRKKNEIMREAKRRRTARSKKGQRRDTRETFNYDSGYAEKTRARAEQKSFFKRLCCCLKADQSAEYEVDENLEKPKVRHHR